MNGNLMKDEEFGSLKLLKLKYRIRKQLIQQVCRIGFHQEIRSPLCNLRKFEKSEKIIPESCRMRWNLISDEEFGSLKLLKLKYRRGDQIIQPFCRVGCPKEIRSPLFNLGKFDKSEKGSPEWCRKLWDLMNDEESGFLRLLKLKYRRGTKYFSVSAELVVPRKLGAPSWICGNLESLRKLLLNHAECIET